MHHAEKKPTRKLHQIDLVDVFPDINMSSLLSDQLVVLTQLTKKLVKQRHFKKKEIQHMS